MSKFKITITLSKSQFDKLEKLHEIIKDNDPGYKKKTLENTGEFAIQEGLRELERIFDSGMKDVA